MDELILTFHGIGDPPADIPDAEIPYWISENDFLGFIDQAKAVSQDIGLRLTVSFDDGNLSDILIAAPILKNSNIDGIFFPCSGRIGKVGYLDANDIRSLSAQGFYIGSHGVDHLPWTSLDTAKLIFELRNSKTVLEEILCHTINSAALPFGSYNRKVLATLRNEGYNTIYSSDPGFAHPHSTFQCRLGYKSGMDNDLKVHIIKLRNPVQKIFRTSKHLIKALR